MVSGSVSIECVTMVHAVHAKCLKAGEKKSNSYLCLDLIKEKAFVLPPVIIRAGINTESSLRYEPFSSHSVTS